MLHIAVGKQYKDVVFELLKKEASTDIVSKVGKW